MNQLKSKRGQLTLWIVIAVLLVALILIFFLVYNPFKINVIQEKIPPSPDIFMSSCMEEPVLETIETISKQGGYLEEPNIFIPYDGSKVGYLCYTNQPYTVCYNQQPFLDKFIEKQIKDEVKKQELIKNCLNNYKTVVQNMDYQITTCQNPEFNVSMQLDKMIFPFYCNIAISNEERTYNYDFVEPQIKTSIGEFVGLSNKIVEQEISNGDFDLILGQIYSNNMEILRSRAGNTKLYILHKVNTNNYFTFAIKNLFQNSGL